MPFTPFHMGPGLLVKALLQGSFSLLVFGYTQVVMDLQPLVVLLTGEGHLHGFSHTFIGATLIALFCGLTGRFLAEYGLRLTGLDRQGRVSLRWWVVMLSAFLGSYSHVALDAVMHADLQPFFPFSSCNPWLRLIPPGALHRFCLVSGAVGIVLCLLTKSCFARRQT